jgi:hypothetical protein
MTKVSRLSRAIAPPPAEPAAAPTFDARELLA